MLAVLYFDFFALVMFKLYFTFLVSDELDCDGGYQLSQNVLKCFGNGAVSYLLNPEKESQCLLWTDQGVFGIQKANFSCLKTAKLRRLVSARS